MDGDRANFEISHHDGYYITVKSAAVVKSDIKKLAPTLTGEPRGRRLFLVFCYNNFLRETLLTLLVFFQFHPELHLRRIYTAGETNFLKETA